MDEGTLKTTVGSLLILTNSGPNRFYNTNICFSNIPQRPELDFDIFGLFAMENE